MKCYVKSVIAKLNISRYMTKKNALYFLCLVFVTVSKSYMQAR